MSTLETRTLSRAMRTCELQEQAQAERDPLLMRTHADMLACQMWALRLVERYSEAYERGCRVAIGLAFVLGSLAVAAHAQDSPVAARPSPLVSGERAAAFYRWSVAAAIAASVADTASSFGPGMEMNPVLGRGRFGPSQVSIKTAGTAALLVMQWHAVRRQPGARKVAAIANFAAAAVLTAVAVRNAGTL